jgi:hypothetical protein
MLQVDLEQECDRLESLDAERRRWSQVCADLGTHKTNLEKCFQEVDGELNGIEDAMRAHVEDAARERSMLEQALATAVIDRDVAAQQDAQSSVKESEVQFDGYCEANAHAAGGAPAGGPKHGGMEDALEYVELVKKRFDTQPRVYDRFLEILTEFKARTIDTPGVIEHVSRLFDGSRDLMLGLNAFLPPGCKIDFVHDRMHVQHGPCAGAGGEGGGSRWSGGGGGGGMLGTGAADDAEQSGAKDGSQFDDAADAAQAIKNEPAKQPMTHAATACLMGVAGTESTAGEAEQVGKLLLEGGMVLLGEQLAASSQSSAAPAAPGTVLSSPPALRSLVAQIVAQALLSPALRSLVAQVVAQIGLVGQQQSGSQQSDSQQSDSQQSDSQQSGSAASMSQQLPEATPFGGVCGASPDDSKPQQSSVAHAGGQPGGGPGGSVCAPCSQSAAQTKSACKKPAVWRGPVMCWRCKQEGHMWKWKWCPAWGIKADALSQVKSQVRRDGGGSRADGAIKHAHSPAVAALVASAGQLAADPNPQPKTKAQVAEVGKSREQHRTRKWRGQRRTRKQKQQGAGGVHADQKGQAQGKAQSAKPVMPAVQPGMPVTETVRGAVREQGASTKSVKSDKPTGASTSVKPGLTYARALIQGVTEVPAETVVQEEAAECAAVGAVPGLNETVVCLEKIEEREAETGQSREQSRKREQLAAANAQAVTKLEVQDWTPQKMEQRCTASKPAEKQQRIASGGSRQPLFVSRRRTRGVMPRCAADCAVQQQQQPQMMMKKMMMMEMKMMEMMSKIESMMKTAEAQIECLMLSRIGK